MERNFFNQINRKKDALLPPLFHTLGVVASAVKRRKEGEEEAEGKGGSENGEKTHRQTSGVEKLETKLVLFTDNKCLLENSRFFRQIIIIITSSVRWLDIKSIHKKMNLATKSS